MTAEAEYLTIAGSDQLPFLCMLAIMMGLGKGGVPGSSTSSVALNSLYAPDIVGGMNSAAALQVCSLGEYPQKIKHLFF
jgi:hypothetical protein